MVRYHGFAETSKKLKIREFSGIIDRLRSRLKSQSIFEVRREA